MDDSSSESLSTFIETCALSVHSSRLTDVLNHLESGSIPGLHSNYLADVEVIKHAIGALRILEFGMFTSYFHKDQLNAPGATPDLIHTAWRDIWRWITFLYMKCITNQAYGEMIMHAALRTIPSTLMRFGWHAGLRLSMIRTPGLIPMLTQQWVQEDTYAKQLELAWDKRYFALALENLFTYGNDKKNDTDKEVITTIVHAAVGGEAAVVRVALQQFDTLLQSKHLDFDTMSLFLTLIHEISYSRPALRPSLLYQGLIPTIISFLRHLPPLGSEKDPPAVNRCTLLAIAILVIFTQTINGPSFIVQGLESGLLVAFVMSWPLIQRADLGLAASSAIHIFVVLKDYLVYRSVLRAVARALKVMKRMGVSAPDCDPWVAFENFALARLLIKDAFDAKSGSRLDPGFTGCANNNVGRDELCVVCVINTFHSADCDPMILNTNLALGAIMICTAILLVRGMIGKATELFVKLGRSLCVVRIHISVSRSFRSEFTCIDGSQVPISQHDRNFLHYVAAIDFCTNISAIKADIAKRFTSTPVSSLYIQLTYIGTPSIVVYPVGMFPWEDEDEKSELETLLHRVRAADGNQMLAQVHVRNGYLPDHGIMLRKFPLLISRPQNWFQD